MMHRCDDKGGYVYAYGTTKDWTKSSAQTGLEEFQRIYFYHNGVDWVMPEGFFREFDFRCDEDREYVELHEIHANSDVGWFDCSKHDYDTIGSDCLQDELPAEYVGKYLVVRDEHFYKGRKRGNVVAAFTPEQFAVLSDKESLYEYYKVWEPN
jgi:hypothetical protein